MPSFNFEAVKNEVIAFCRKGLIPLTFQENTRMLFASKVGRGGGADGFCDVLESGLEALVRRRFAGGGLVSRLILVQVRYPTTTSSPEVARHE